MNYKIPYNNVDIKTKTTYDYEYGITGYNNVAQTVYTRIIKISSYDFNLLKEQNELIQLWETEIISTGKSSDLRKIFPALIAASEDYIGEDTKETISLTISEEDDRIEEYRN